MSLKVSSVSYNNLSNCDSIQKLSRDSLLQIFHFIQKKSVADLQVCRQVCRDWSKLGDTLIFKEGLSKIYTSSVEKAKAGIQSVKTKYIQSIMMARLAKITGDTLQSHEMLQKAFKIAEQIGWTHEYCDEDGSKGGEYDGERITCYLKIIQSYASLGKTNDIFTCMKGSEQAEKIAIEDFKGKDLQIYTDIAKIFVPIGQLDEIIPIIQSHPYYDVGVGQRSLLIQAIKTYSLESQYNPFFLKELNANLDKSFDLVKNYTDNPSFYNRYSLLTGLNRCMQLIKGYCYLGYMSKAIEIIKHIEDEKKRLGEDTSGPSKEWFSKAYLVVAKAWAQLGQIEQTQIMIEKISDDSESFMKGILNATSYIKNKDKENGLKLLKSAEKLCYSSCGAHLALAKLFFEINHLFEALGHLKKAEEKAKQSPSYQCGEVFLSLGKVTRWLALSTPSN